MRCSLAYTYTAAGVHDIYLGGVQIWPLSIYCAPSIYLPRPLPGPEGPDQGARRRGNGAIRPAQRVPLGVVAVICRGHRLLLPGAGEGMSSWSTPLPLQLYG